MFLVMSSIISGNSAEFCYIVSRINLPQNCVNVFHITWMILPCETWNGHCARGAVRLSEKETTEFIPPQLCLPNSPDFNPVDCSVWKILQEKVYKTHITDLDELKSDWERSGPSWVTSSLRQTFISSVIASDQLASRLVMDISNTVSDFGQHTVSVSIVVNSFVPFVGIFLHIEVCGSSYLHVPWRPISRQFIYEDNVVKVKVIGAKMVANSYSRNVKLRSAMTPRFYKTRSHELCM